MMSEHKTITTIFDKLSVSTTTVTTNIDADINLVDLAKYLPLNENVLGVKLVYAGGKQTIVRGLVNAPKDNKKFLNQVTLTLRVPLTDLGKTIIVSVKVFQNGKILITGTHNIEESIKVSELLVRTVANINIPLKGIILKESTELLLSHDDLMFTSDGKVYGWHCEGDTYHMSNEYVNLEDCILPDGDSYKCLVSKTWSEHRKLIYSLFGEIIGEKRLEFDQPVRRRHYEVKFGCIFYGNQVIGKEAIRFKKEAVETLLEETRKRMIVKQAGWILHDPTFIRTTPKTTFAAEDFETHMINMFTGCSYSICRLKLHSFLLEYDMDSRYRPSYVDIRYHYNKITQDGRCTKYTNPDSQCYCKIISISCFNSGKVNITGLSEIEQGDVVYAFMQRLFSNHADKFRIM